ncbi:MAG: histidine kinase [Acidiferrobacter sp.]
MTGSYPKKGLAGRLKDIPVPLPWRTKRADGRANLLYLRAKSPEQGRPLQDLSGALYTLGGVCLGLLGGYLGYHYRFSDEIFSLRRPVLLLVGAPALFGGAVGAFVAWLHARAKLAQALVTSEGFRQRLMSVERNQALWISLSAVLHDVRNPLHNIYLLIEHLEPPQANIDRVRQQILEQLERINVRVQRVVAQVAEFSGEICRRPIGLTSVLKEVSEMIKPLARQSHVNLVMDPGEDTMVMADPKFLVQAIDHLRSGPQF